MTSKARNGIHAQFSPQMNYAYPRSKIYQSLYSTSKSKYDAENSTMFKQFSTKNQINTSMNNNMSLRNVLKPTTKKDQGSCHYVQVKKGGHPSIDSTDKPPYPNTVQCSIDKHPLLSQQPQKGSFIRVEGSQSAPQDEGWLLQESSRSSSREVSSLLGGNFSSQVENFYRRNLQTVEERIYKRVYNQIKVEFQEKLESMFNELASCLQLDAKFNRTSHISKDASSFIDDKSVFKILHAGGPSQYEDNSCASRFRSEERALLEGEQQSKRMTAGVQEKLQQKGKEFQSPLHTFAKKEPSPAQNQFEPNVPIEECSIQKPRNCSKVRKLDLTLLLDQTHFLSKYNTSTVVNTERDFGCKRGSFQGGAFSQSHVQSAMQFPGGGAGAGGQTYATENQGCTMMMGEEQSETEGYSGQVKAVRTMNITHNYESNKFNADMSSNKFHDFKKTLMSQPASKAFGDCCKASKLCGSPTLPSNLTLLEMRAEGPEGKVQRQLSIEPDFLGTRDRWQRGRQEEDYNFGMQARSVCSYRNNSSNSRQANGAPKRKQWDIPRSHHGTNL